MKINSEILKECASHVSDYMSENLDKKYYYHNIRHTINVVNAVKLICAESGIDKHRKKLLIAAAWFHDLGYTLQMEQHESIGAALAEKFFQERDVDQLDIEEIKSCILSTHFPQQPVTLLQEIICDADMMHLASKKFSDGAALLRKEWEYTRDLHYSDSEWYELNINFLSSHQFHTSSCIKAGNKGKVKNIEKFKKELASIKHSKVIPAGNRLEYDLPGKTKKSTERLERGVETLFRTASGNHMRLSAMADNKAHILLSINSIIISVIVSLLAKKLAEASVLLIPTILLLSVSAVSVVYAVLTTKPKISKGIFTKEQISNRQVNLLFFGNFHRMDLDTYEWGINELMYDKEYLYKSMTKDIYFLGKVLAAKYHYLNIGYRVFMYGLMASVIAFGISFLVAMHGG